jgi:hypothetical protein
MAFNPMAFNPITKRKITFGGRVYKSLISQGYTDEQLKYVGEVKPKRFNPITNKVITYGGKVYKKLIREGYNDEQLHEPKRFNPITKEVITYNGKVYKQFLRDGYTDEQLQVDSSIESIENSSHSAEYERIASERVGEFTDVYRRTWFDSNDILTIMNSDKDKIKSIITRFLAEKHSIKFRISPYINYVKNGKYQTWFHNTEYKIVYESSDIDQVIADFISNLYDDITEKMIEGSGWTIDKINYIEIKMMEYLPAAARSYFPTPSYVPGKSIVNVHNYDEQCFKWAILSAIHPFEKDAQRVSKYQFDNILTRFVHNSHNLYKHCWKCLNGFASESKYNEHIKNCDTISPRKFPVKGQDDIVEFKNYKNMQPKPFWIALDFEAFNIPLEHGDQKTNKIASQEANSFAYAVVSTSYYSKTLNKIEKKENEPDMTYETNAEEFRQYRGPDIYATFFEYLENDIEKILERLENPTWYERTPETKMMYQEKTCYLCCKEFLPYNDIKKLKIEAARKNGKDWFKMPVNEEKVIDHCHLTGRLRGICHRSCNTKMRWMKETIEIPIIVHNLRGYDEHLILKGLSTLEKKYKIKLIPTNKEKYQSVTLDNARFIDSFQFVSKSLEKLISEIKGSGDKAIHDCDKLVQLFPITAKYFDKNKLDYVTSKGVYPYEYVKAFNDFESALPNKNAFDSHLNDSISDKDYNFAKEVYSKFECRNFGDYHDLYLKTDVLLLADYWAMFSRMFLEQYRLDPNHYYSAPGMAFDACLLTTGQKVELITDPDIFNFVKKGMRGGISMARCRYAKANNKHCPDYDLSKENSWPMYFDATALYSWAMMEPLPTGGHEFVDDSIDEILSTADDSPKGYLVKCKITIPNELHDYFKDYPPCPVNETVDNAELSRYQKKLLTDNNVKPGTKTAKLLCNLKDKDEYHIHYRLLKLFVKLGVKVDKVYQVLRFNQSPWMKPYIEKNNAIRKEAQLKGIDSLIELAKLMNNAVYGKTMEDVEKRIDVQILQMSDVSDKFLKLSSSVRFVDYNKVSDNMVVVHLRKTKVYLNKPIYVGQAVLDISKCHMYDFYYNVLKSRYNDNMKLLYTDTDSLIIDFKTENIYKDLAEIKDKFDMSGIKNDYGYRDLLYDPVTGAKNIKVPGMFKDETNGIPIYEVVCLKAKMYSYKMVNEKNDRHAKGIKKRNIKEDLSHEKFKDVLFNKTMNETVTQYSIQSKNHSIGLYESTKSSLTAFDDKNYILDNGYDMLPYGHYKILSGGNSD